MSTPIVVRLTKNKKQYEILTHHGAVEKFKQQKIGWSKVTFSDEVYKNSSKGDRYTNKDLEKAFGTSNIEECMKQIVLHGELQLTTQDRKRKTEEKRKQIINNIHKYYINPKTKQPHPVTHITAALDQVKFKTDLKESVEKQTDRAMKLLLGILICKKSVLEGTLTVSNAYIGTCFNTINGLCDVISQKYTTSGCEMYISVIPGNYDTLATKLNAITKGEFDFVAASNETVSSASIPIVTSKKGKKKKKGKRNKGQ